MNGYTGFWKPFGTPFTFGLRVIRCRLFLIFLSTIFLSLAFQIQWQKNEGQENERGISNASTNCCKQETCFSVSPKNVGLSAKAASLGATFAEQKATIFENPIKNW
jgi:hypothetical protein